MYKKSNGFVYVGDANAADALYIHPREVSFLMRFKFLAFCGVVMLLAGCSSLTETMFTHYRLSESNVVGFAQMNALVNTCLVNDAINKDKAYALSNASAQLLDITVIDRDFYAKTYRDRFDALSGTSGINEGCTKFETEFLDKAITRTTEMFISISTQLSIARAQERQQMARILSDFSNNMAGVRSTSGYSSLSSQYGWPKVSYSSQTNETAAFLVNTSKGHVQCKVTNKNYVFCM